jgi:phosphoribosylformimino-5-aminoimidazole carboxamide ribotide isomerase
MQIWPAIDLRGGKCVRLQQGDYERETIFHEDPAAMARWFHEQGAEFLHIVDLDGARAGAVANWRAIEAIVAAAPLACELGGGIRDQGTIERLLALGFARLVIGTLAIREADWFRQMCRRFPNRMALGIDARDGMVATHGWLETSQTAAIDLAQRFASEPLAAIIYTDIAKDGMLAGPNLAALDAMRQAVDKPLVASGGVTTPDDVERLARLPVDGAIIGRALYEGTLSLRDALARASPAAS